MERYTRPINQMLDLESSEFSFIDQANIIRLEKEGKILLGVIAGKSIFIPLSFNQETNQDIKDMVSVNLNEIDKIDGKSTPEQASFLLGLPFCGKFDEYMCDGSAIGNQTITALHIYPAGHCESEEDFVKGVFESLNTRGVEVSEINI